MKLYSLLLVFLGPVLFAQQGQSVDFKTLSASLEINPVKRNVMGKVTYAFEVKNTIDTIRIDAQKMVFTNLKINNKTVKFKENTRQLLLFEGFKKGSNQLTFDYVAFPNQTMYFINWETEQEINNLKEINGQIWTQGQGKYTSHWLPSFDDVNEKVVFNLDISFQKEFTVVSNGVLVNQIPKENSILWQFHMKKPMSSYLVMLAIGKFEKKTLHSKSGIPLDLYIEKEDFSKWEPTYRYSKEIFDFLEMEIGVPYPWETYSQVPVRDFLYAGMENTTATVFSRDFVVDSIGFNDRNYVNVNAHELAHQWFGDLVTAESGQHHWLQEGFATYYALLSEKAVFGADYFHWKLYEAAENLLRASKTDTIPILNKKASSLSFYQKGAWALHVLKDGVGEEQFRKAVKNYLEKHQFKNVVTDDFLAEINRVSSYDTNRFRKQWLEKSGFEVAETIALLKKNPFMKQYFEVLDLAEQPFQEKRLLLEAIMKSDAYFPIKEEILFQCKNVPFEEKSNLLRLALQTHNLNVRQAVAQTVSKIPTGFEKEIESLLEDDSFITQEIMLNLLWSQFPEKRIPILQRTRSHVGFNDKNLRILWLTLALATKEFEPEQKTQFYDELLEYASPDNESSVRQNALTNLLFINKKDTNYLKYLVNATMHHKWQITKFARDAIRELLKNKSHRTYFEELLPQVSQREQMQLNRLLKEKL